MKEIESVKNDKIKNLNNEILKGQSEVRRLRIELECTEDPLISS